MQAGFEPPMVSVAVKLGRRFIGIELSTPHCEMARRRIGEVAPLLSGQVWEGKG